jgi:hypothetical protein
MNPAVLASIFRPGTRKSVFESLKTDNFISHKPTPTTMATPQHLGSSVLSPVNPTLQFKMSGTLNKASTKGLSLESREKIKNLLAKRKHDFLEFLVSVQNRRGKKTEL